VHLDTIAKSDNLGRPIRSGESSLTEGKVDNCSRQGTIGGQAVGGRQAIIARLHERNRGGKRCREESESNRCRNEHSSKATR